MRLLVIDGQGGSLGKAVIELVKKEMSECEIIAVGTNGIATSAMLKAGADYGATGENPVVVNCRNADIIVGPVGILAADSLFGEVTEKMAKAVCQSGAKKIIIPVNKCHITVVGVMDMSFADYVKAAVEQIKLMGTKL